MKNLNISKDLSLPPDIVTQKIAWLGTTGSGKTYAASKLAEEMWTIHAQFVVLDPVGVWYGLRLGPDGKKPSAIDIPIFGGLHGDVPLESTAGELLANLVVDKGLSCIIDVSQFESDAEKARFATAFAKKLFFRKKGAPSAIHLFLEECQEFVPQNPQRGEETMLHAFVVMQKLGRNFGIGSSYITQRPQEVNKKALNMCQNLFVFRNTGTHERVAIEKWIEDKSLDESIAADLPKIPTGNCHIWSPEYLKISKVIRISEKETYNASATPEVGAIAKSRQLAPIDLEKVRKEMLATIEKAEKEDPKLLRKKVVELEQKLTKISNNPQKIVEKAAKVVEKPVLKDDQIKRIESVFVKMVNEANKHGNAMALLWGNFNKIGYTMIEALKAIKSNREISQKQIFKSPVQEVKRPVIKDIQKLETNEISTIEDLKPIVKGELAILKAIAQDPEGISTEHIAVLTGYKKTSRITYLSKLIQRGFITKNQYGTYIATEAGIEELGDDYESMPIGVELRERLMDTLPIGEKKVLEILIAEYPESLHTSQIEERTGYKKTSRITYVSKLASRKLVTVDQGRVRANDKLFD